MKKWPKKLWLWILSGLVIILGGCSLFHWNHAKLYGPPTLYGPPPSDSSVFEFETEKVYGPPVPDVEPDSIVQKP